MPTDIDWDAKWNQMLAILQEFADSERRGYQLIFLADSDNHHEEVVAQILPSGVTEYDPENRKYSDGIICANCGKLIVPGDDPGSYCHFGPNYWIHCGPDGEGETTATPRPSAD
jgi:hypothetical protein